MRVNVYAEELTGETALVVKTSEQGQTFYGVRFYLASPDVLHNTVDDDDRSAVTIFVPWTHDDGFDWEKVRNVLHSMLAELETARTTEHLNEMERRDAEAFARELHD